MTDKSTKTLEFKFERTIPAPNEVFDAWLDSSIPGTPWVASDDKLLVNPQVDGLWYWLVRGNAHYGRFTEVKKPGRIQFTWMSRYTLGEESLVTVTFRKREKVPT